MSTRTQGILDRVSDAPKFSGVRWILGDGVLTNYMQSFVDDTMKRNAEFQSKAGVSPKIVRKSPTKCCPWCDALVGTYNYPDDVPDDVYRRHDNCNCIVEFYPGDGHKQNVWTKSWDESDPEILGKRKTAGLKSEKVKKVKVIHGEQTALIRHDGMNLYRIEGTADNILKQAKYQQSRADGLIINMDNATKTIDDIEKELRGGMEPPFNVIFISANDKKILKQIKI